MSHPLYDKYLSDMKRLKATPPYMTETQVLESLGITVEEEHSIPLHITPKKQVIRKIPTDEDVVEPKPKVEKKQKHKSNPKKIKEPKKERANLSNMTPDEIREHKAKLQRERMAKKKASGWVYPPRTKEQKEKRNEYFKYYYAEKRNDPEFMAKRAKAVAESRARQKEENKLLKEIEEF
jgi:hypothetical protein